MQLLKYVAEALAIKSNAAEVNLDHIRSALRMLQLRDGVAANLVLRYLKMRRSDRSAPSEHIIRLVELARTTPALPLSDEVKEFVDTFGEDYQLCVMPPFATPLKSHNTTNALARSPNANATLATATTQQATMEQLSVDAATAFDPWLWGEDGLPSPTQAVALSKSLRHYLNDRLLGQTQVVDALADGIVREALRGERRGPLVTLFLVGPPACGKTYTSELLTDALKGDWPRKTIDMGSMQSANQAFALTGMSRGYSDAVPGELTGFVRQNPRSIVVLENIDKAHPNIQNVLLPVFESGFLKDQFGFYPNNDYTKPELAPPEVDFRSVILIVTTSAASGTLQNAEFQTYLDDHPEQTESAIIELLAKQEGNFQYGPLPCFSAELLSRLSSQLMLVYRPLALAALESIAQKTYQAFCQSLELAFEIEVECSQRDALIRAATLSFGGKLDARRVAGSALENTIFGPVIDEIQAIDTALPIKRVVFVLDDAFCMALDHLVRDLDPADPVRDLLRKQRSLNFSRTPELSGDQILVRWTNPHWITTVRATDIGKAGGLQTVIPDCGFSEIAGHERVKKRLLETVRLLREPKQLKELGVSLPRGMLLYGAPGTGKTMLAKALANEADLPFLSTTGPELLDPEMMHAVFERARYYAPSILFIDEIDALGTRDGQGYPIPINQLLAELDGFNSHAGGVFTVSATNYPERIDRAILRSGRIDLHIEVPALDRPARLYFFERLKALPGGESLDFDGLVRLSSGMSGAGMEQVRRELALDLIRTGKSKITQAEAEEMVCIIKYGERRAVAESNELLRHTAYHEAGHALVSRALMPERLIEQITIVPRARYAGMVSFDADQLRRPMTRQQVLNEMAVGLSGRLSQSRKFGDAGVDDGASSDLEKVTALAQQAIASWGLDEVIGCRVVDLKVEGGSIAISERVTAWIKEATIIAEKQLEQDANAIEALVQKLLSDETLDGDELSECLAKT